MLSAIAASDSISATGASGCSKLTSLRRGFQTISPGCRGHSSETGIVADGPWVALVWPGRVLHAFDGLPLDCVSKAVVLGVTFPMLWLLAPGFLNARWTRLAIVLLLAVKVGGSVLLTQQGLCARFSTTAPVHTRILTIPIDEPDGVLRSWDVRADWRAEAPKCTAVVDRSYETWAAFPVWFVNFTDFIDLPDRVGVRTEDSTRRFTLDISGAVTVADAGLFSIDLGRDMELDGRIDSTNVASAAGAALSVPLGPGVHDVQLRVSMTGDQWTFMPKWNGRSAFQTTTLTVKRPRAADRWLAPAVANSTIGIVALLLLAWTGSVIARYSSEPRLLIWTVGASAVLSVMSIVGRGERAAGLLLLGAAAVPVGASARNWRGALMLIGVPWLVFFVVRTLPQVGHVSLYSVDDWLAYQVAGYRIYMNGFWLEGGNRLFDYQPLYRWMPAVSISSSAIRASARSTGMRRVCWRVGSWRSRSSRPSAGFDGAVGAAAATLATFTLGPIWYFVGRGLSEIAAAGFAFYVALSIVRADGRLAVSAVAGVLAVLMFYARLNQLIFAVCLAALWLPPDVPAAWRRLPGRQPLSTQGQ